MKNLVKLNLAQRIVAVVALGVTLGFFGIWVTSLDATPIGWVAYAPLSKATYGPIHPGGLTFGEVILIWIALTVVWARCRWSLCTRPRAIEAMPVLNFPTDEIVPELAPNSIEDDVPVTGLSLSGGDHQVAIKRSKAMGR